jgi:hypothetical protein
MLSPFWSGSSPSSADISLIFGAGPKEAVEVSRAQGEVVDLVGKKRRPRLRRAHQAPAP